MATLNLNFDAPIPTPDEYIVRFREKGTSDPYTEVTVVSAPPFNVTHVNIIFGKDYEGFVIPDCGDDNLGDPLAFTTDDYEWIPGDYICEQDEVYTQEGQITTLSSPALLVYDSTSGLVYGVDHDKPGGNFFRYNPNTAAVAADIIFTPLILKPGATNYIFAYASDSINRRVFASGRDTDGVQVFNAATNTVSVVICGSNHNVAPTGLGNGFNRTFLKNTGNYIVNYNSYNKMFYFIDKNSLTVTITKSMNFGTNGVAYLCEYINNEIWVCGSNDPNISIYDSTFANLLTTITLSSYSAIWTNGVYWKSFYHDVTRNRMYLVDMGNNYLLVINTITKTIVHSFRFENRLGKSNVALTFAENPVTGKFYISGDFRNDINSDLTPKKITYEFDRDTNSLSRYFKNVGFYGLTRIGITNKVHGAFPGLVQWSGGAWSTDGTITKFVS